MAIKNDETMIVVKRVTAEKLKEIGKKSETYDMVINRLILHNAEAILHNAKAINTKTVV